jgi:hypothetical protein
VSRVARATQQPPARRPGFPKQPKMDRPFVRGAPVRRRTLWRKATAWRNEVTNGHEKPEVGLHHCVAISGVVALLRKSPTIRGLLGLCGCLHDCPGLSFENTRFGLSTVPIRDRT